MWILCLSYSAAYMSATLSERRLRLALHIAVTQTFVPHHRIHCVRKFLSSESRVLFQMVCGTEIGTV